MSKRITLLLGLILVSLSLVAVNDDAGTTGFNSLKIIYSARANAMGGAFSSIDDDSDVIFFNPANLGGYSRLQEVSSTFMNYFAGYNGGSVVYQSKQSDRLNIAFFGQFLTSDNIPKTIDAMNGGYEEVGTFSNSDLVIGGTYSYYFNEQISFGINGKFINESIDSKSASAIAFDVGILHRPVNDKIRVGAVIRNLGAQVSHFTKSKYDEGLPVVYAGGISYRTVLRSKGGDEGFAPTMLLSLDLELPKGADFTGLFGAEFAVHEQFLLRLGYKTNAGDYKNGGDYEAFSGISTGVGFVRNNLKIDYALNSYGDLGFVNQVTLKYHF